MVYKRRELIVSNEVYHIFNRSIGDEEIFMGARENNRFLELFNFYRFEQKLRYSKFRQMNLVSREEYFKDRERSKPIIDLFAFALMPNHYHILLKQLEDRGVYSFISNVQNAYAKYFNKKNSRLGGVFLRPFKSKIILKDEILTHVSRYIHLNPVTSHIIEYEPLKSYQWTSFPDYLGITNREFINTNFILKFFRSRYIYEKFVANQADYQKKLQRIKNFILE